MPPNTDRNENWLPMKTGEAAVACMSVCVCSIHNTCQLSVVRVHNLNRLNWQNDKKRRKEIRRLWWKGSACIIHTNFILVVNGHKPTMAARKENEERSTEMAEKMNKPLLKRWIGQPNKQRAKEELSCSNAFWGSRCMLVHVHGHIIRWCTVYTQVIQTIQVRAVY